MKPPAPALLTAALAALLVACGGESTPAADAPAATPPPAPSAGLPSLPGAEMQRLVDSATYIDYVFFEQAFSMSMNEPSAIRYALANVSPQPAAPRQACPAIGRIFYKIGGRTVHEADLHFAPGCTYLKFYGPDQQPAYANELSPTGKAFFNSQFRQLIPNYSDIE